MFVLIQQVCKSLRGLRRGRPLFSCLNPPGDSRWQLQGNSAFLGRVPERAFPVHRRNFVRQSDIAFVNKQLENTRKNRSFGENPWQRGSKTQNVGKSLSSCHLNKQRLINSLEAEVDESARLIESTGVTPPYKISRFHRESLWLLRVADQAGTAHEPLPQIPQIKHRAYGQTHPS